MTLPDPNSKPLRIAFLIDVFPRLSNTFILNQITGLIDRGHDVDIFAIHTGDLETVHADVTRYDLLSRMRHIPIPRARGQRYKKALGLLLQPEHWRGAVFDSLNVLRYGNRATSLANFYTTLSFMQQAPYDIVHAQFGKLGLVALPLKKHGVISGKLATSFRGADITSTLAKHPGIYDDLLTHGDLFLPVSNLFKQKLIQEGCAEQKIRVNRSGIALDRFVFKARQKPGNAPTRILFIGRLTEKKGVRYAIEAVTQVIKNGHDLQFHILGDGELTSEAHALIQQHHMSQHIHLLGHQPQNNVIQELESAHILIAPSVTASDNDQEGIPNVVKEAMAVGLPVVSTLHSGIPELVDDGISGYLVPEKDSDALATKLEHLVTHPELWEQMGKAGRAKVEADYDIERLNDDLIRYYREAINR